jgi:peptidoglycan/xylan/chitin deacetylase (PgdA/CDA1 family)
MNLCCDASVRSSAAAKLPPCRQEVVKRQSALRSVRALTFLTVVILGLSMGSFAKALWRQASRAPGVHAGKLIALTFDDGPKPYVLLGTASGSGVHSKSLLAVLTQQRVKATFFVMGWRLSKNADAWCRRVDGGSCRVAAEEEHREGDEIENHTYGHGDFRLMERRYGDAWILNDIERASKVIQSITGVRPQFVRPPDWDIWPALSKKVEGRGYWVMTKSDAVPPKLRDVDSEDYFCAGKDVSKCPKPSDYDYVLRRIRQREVQGVDDHILAFHELPQTVQMLTQLIPVLKERGYRFVLLRDYVEVVAGRRL